MSNICKRIYLIIKNTSLGVNIKRVFNSVFNIRGNNNKLINFKYLNKPQVRIIGNNNLIQLGENTFVHGLPILIRGNNNSINIGDNVRIFQIGGGNILLEGNNVKITIDDNTTIQGAHINAQEDNSEIYIGKCCMLSNNIVIRTSDSHPIYDKSTKKRLNSAKSVYIEDHVWIAAHASILKGCKIGAGAIIGLGSVVTRNIPESTIAGGNPAKVLKENVYWNHSLNLVEPEFKNNN